MKLGIGLLSVALLVAMVGCGGSSGQSFAPGPTPVLAQSGFSNGTLTGTYGVSFVGTAVATNTIQSVGDGIGTIQFDGNGNVTGGSITEYTSNGACTYALSGTYSVSSTGAVQTALTSTPTTSGCTGATGGTYGGEVSQTGNSAVFAESDGNASGGSFLAATAVKQQ